MEDGAWNLNSIAEEDFENQAVFLVPDAPCEDDSVNRAEANLPRNLTLKPSQTHGDVSITHQKKQNVHQKYAVTVNSQQIAMRDSNATLVSFFCLSP